MPDPTDGDGRPPVLYETSVLPEWVDYNGHMSEAYYVLVAGFTTDALLDLIGMNDAFRRRTGHSLYTLESHICYLREVGEGEPLRVTTRVVDLDHKRVHVFHELWHAEEGHAVATAELVACNVDAATSRSAPLLPDIRSALQDLLTAHQQLPSDDRLGHHISLRR